MYASILIQIITRKLFHVMIGLSKLKLLTGIFFYFSNSDLDLYPTGPKSNANLRFHASLLYPKIQQVWFIPNEVIDRKPSV